MKKQVAYILFFSTTSAVLFNEGTVFFSHKKSASVATSAKFQQNEQGQRSAS